MYFCTRTDDFNIVKIHRTWTINPLYLAFLLRAATSLVGKQRRNARRPISNTASILCYFHLAIGEKHLWSTKWRPWSILRTSSWLRWTFSPAATNITQRKNTLATKELIGPTTKGYVVVDPVSRLWLKWVL